MNEEDLNNGTPILMSDIRTEKQTDSFLGEGTEELIKEAEKKEVDIIVGRFYKKPYLDE